MIYKSWVEKKLKIILKDPIKQVLIDFYKKEIRDNTEIKESTKIIYKSNFIQCLYKFKINEDIINEIKELIK